jgi:hypothetical protein
LRLRGLNFDEFLADLRWDRIASVAAVLDVKLNCFADIGKRFRADAVAGLVGIEGGVASGVFNLESSGVEAPDRRPRHDKRYHEA